VKRFLFFLLLFVSISSSAEVIKDINITGISSLSRGTILSYLPIEVGDEFTDEISNNALQILFSSELIDDASILFKDGSLNINIKESPTISYFEVKGFKNDRVLNEDKLLETLKDLKLTSGSIFRKRVLQTFLKKLEQQYEISGHYNAKIQSNIKIDNENRIDIAIDIIEGEVARINSFKIIGANFFDEDTLLDKFNIGEPDFFLVNFWTEKDYFSKLELDAGIEKIKSLYISSGFIDFEILEPDIQLSDDKTEISVLLSLNEGQRYTIKNINFTGDFLEIPTKQLSKTLDVHSGEIFEQKKLIKGLERINDFYGDQGFAFAKIDAKTQNNKVTHEIDININIDIRNRIYLNRIIITGNTRTQDDVIRREIKLLEGQQYSRKDLEKSIENIKRLAYFKNVDMKTSKTPGSIDKIDIFISVDENKTGELSLGLSQSSTTGAAFNFGIKERNFLGTGNTLNAQFVNSEAVEEMSFFFSNPDFNGQKHTLSYGAFSRKTDSKYVDISSYTLNETGLNASYGIPMNEYSSFSNGFKLSNVDLQCGAIYATNETNQCGVEKKTKFSLKSSISENSLNDSIYPTDGLKNRLSIDLDMPLSDFSVYKIDLSHSSYYPLSSGLTFKFNTNIGYIDTYDDSETPFYERYFGGGSNSIRGFGLNSLGPRYSDNSNKGGEISFLSSSTLISPLSFIEDSDNMRVGAFIDLGSITESVDKFNFSDLRASTGVAFSWYTPVGPLGVHWSKPLISKSGDNLESFAFNLGSSF